MRLADHYEYFVAALFLVVLVESILILAMNRWYFKVGIPVFRRRDQLVDDHAQLQSPDALEEQFASGPFDPILFRTKGENYIAFREGQTFRSFFTISYFTVMRGCLLYDPKARVVTTTGYVNLWPFLVGYLVLGGSLRTAFGISLVVGMLAGSYLIQRSRYTKIATAAASGFL